MPRTRPLTLVALVVALCLPVLSCGWVGGSDLPPARQLCDLGRENRQGVAGHDLAASTRLEDGRVLFAFGDTYLGSVRGDERRTLGLLNSTGAVLPADADICSDDLRYLTDADGAVRALLPRPDDRSTAYWPVDLADDGDRVWMLYRWVERTGDGPLEVRVKGTGLAVADRSDLRFRRASRLLTRGGRPLPTALHAHGGDLLAMVCASGDEGDCRMRRLDRTRTRLGGTRPEPVLDLAGAEMSLGRVRVGGEARWRAASTPDLGCRVRVATLGDEMWWVRTVLAPDVDEGHLCYAGRVQEPFSDAQRVVVTWVDTPGDDRTDGDAYWPHVEQVDLDR